MFRVDPPPTPYDLHFKIGPIPVRISPWFWLMALLLGRPFDTPTKQLMIWVVAVLVSILIHELGHALVAIYFYRCRTSVLLYQMGGLAFYHPNRTTPYREVAVSAAGPGAGFVLAGLMCVALLLSGNELRFGDFTKLDFRIFAPMPDANVYLFYLVNQMLYLNIIWGMVNLLPVYPLDGGQISRSLLQHYRPHDGLRQSLVLSIMTGICMAVFAWFIWESLFVAFMFGYLAYMSYTMFQMVQHGGFGSGGYGSGGGWRGYDDQDDDWRGKGP